MLRAGAGISVSHNPRTAAIEAVPAAMTQAGLAQATGAIFFATTAHGGAFPLILRTIGEETKTPEVAGCSTVGVIASESEVESGPALSVLVFGGDDINAKRLFVPSLRGRAREVALELAAAVKPALGAQQPAVHVRRHLQHERRSVSRRAGSRASGRRDRRRRRERGWFHRRDLPILRRHGQLQFGLRDADFRRFRFEHRRVARLHADWPACIA